MGALLKGLFLANPGEIIVKFGRILYTALASIIGLAWYTEWRNQRVPQGSFALPIPGLSKSPVQFDPSRPDALPPADQLGAAVSEIPQLQPLTSLSPKAGQGRVTIASNANRRGTHLAPELLTFLNRVSEISGQPIVIGTGTNHSKFVAGTNRISDHWDGHAADIVANAKDPKQRAFGDQIAAAGLIAAGVDSKSAHERARRGGLYTINWRGHRVQVIWKTMDGGNHFTHVHIGFR